MLGLVAFVELVAVGVALALRNQASPEPVIVERVVTEYVPLAITAPEVPNPAGPTPEPVPTTTRPEPRPLPKAFTNTEELMSIPPAPESSLPKLKAPFIDDPVVERLVREAREARVKGNIGAAIVKLEEAQKAAPDDANILYQFAEIFEAVGNYEKAADYYEKVFALGPRKAGSLLKLAAHKLSHGFESAGRMEGKLTLGRIRHFNDKRVEAGERIIITVPIVSAPGQHIEPNNVTVDVFFFDKQNDKIREAIETSQRSQKWLTEPVDWKDDGEELLQVTYVIPPADERDLHLVGKRTYFGQVVELHYGEELLDHQAWPRTLARQRNVPEANPLFIPEEFIPENLNESNPLLPPLPR